MVPPSRRNPDYKTAIDQLTYAQLSKPKLQNKDGELKC